MNSRAQMWLQFMLVLIVMAVLSAIGLYLKQQLREHGSIRGMAKAAVRQGRAEHNVEPYSAATGVELTVRAEPADARDGGGGAER